MSYLDRISGQRPQRHANDFICHFGKLPLPLYLGKFFKEFEKNPENTQNWENKDHFLIGKDSLIRRYKRPNKITACHIGPAKAKAITITIRSHKVLRFHFVSFLLNVPVNNFSVISGQSHCFLGITSTFWEVNVSCSRTQHGNQSEDRTPDLLLRSPMLYH